jgi:adenylate kinase family enzyme
MIKSLYMIGTMNNVLGDNIIVGGSPIVVEISGPAGAGKTTLLQALDQCDEKIVTGVRLHKVRYIPFFASNSLLFLPTFLRQYRHSRWFTWRETRSMAYLKAWHHVLKRQVSNNNLVTVLDHGPIYRLALLREFGPEITRSQTYERWWDRMLKQWATIMYMVVWLDAPDVVLLERIHTRNRWHIVKGKSGREAYGFLARYRTSYEQIITRLTANGGPKLLRFETHQKSVDQIVDEVLAAFNPESNEN